MYNQILLVSGLKKSGKSMVMRMLDSAHVPIVTSKPNKNDKYNPYRNYSHSKIKHIKKNESWINCAINKAIKIPSSLLPFLTNKKEYKLIFILRDINNILEDINELKNIDDSYNQLVETYSYSLELIKSWLERQNNIKTMYVSYDNLINDTEQSAHDINMFINEFIPDEIKNTAIHRMLTVIS